MKKAMKMAIMIAVTAGIASTASAQGNGPVIKQCADEIKKLCAGKSHDGSVRACLEENRSQLTTKCKSALDTTGGGQGRRKN
jgi:hypothetical protein